MSSAPPRPSKLDLPTALRQAGQLGLLIPAIEAVAADHSEVCLVGGSVRDLLLGVQHLDVDIVVEGNAIEFARALSRKYVAKVVEHERFQTATIYVLLEDSSKVNIDVAASRTERYATPGGLPQVEPASLTKDLGRRDFTINAMAVSLKREDFGQLYDPFNGLKDIEARVVRVLHSGSFSDDPTRLLRAVRYAARLDFAIEPDTLGLARTAATSGAIGRMASERVRDELTDLLRESRSDSALELMESLGLDQALLPGLSAGGETRLLLAALPEAVRLAGAGYRVSFDLARIAVLTRSVDPEALATWLDGLQFDGPARDRVVDAVRSADRLARDLNADLPRSRLHALLDGHSPECLALTAAIEPTAAAPIALYFGELEHILLEIGGGDLIAAGAEPGPALGRALRETLDLKLDGRVSGRDQELAAAIRLLRSPSSD